MEQAKAMGVQHVMIHGRALADTAFVNNDVTGVIAASGFFFRIYGLWQMNWAWPMWPMVPIRMT